MSSPLQCKVASDTGDYMRRQGAAEALERARTKAAECVDVIAALERLREADYRTYCDLNAAFVSKDAALQHKISQDAFETEINQFIENEPSLLRDFRRSRIANEVKRA